MADKAWTITITGTWVETGTWCVRDEKIETIFKAIAEDYFEEKILKEEMWENPGIRKSVSRGIYFVDKFIYKKEEKLRLMYAKWVTDADGYGELLLKAEPIRFIETIEDIYQE